MSYANPYALGIGRRPFVSAGNVSGFGGYPLGQGRRPFVSAGNVSGFGAADLTSGYTAARDQRLAREAQQAALVASRTPMVRLDPVVIPPAAPFPKALTAALALAGVAAVVVVGYAFVSGRK